MQKIRTKNVLNRAEMLFSSRLYVDALKEYSKLLTLVPRNRDAKIGVLLSDLATDNEEYAHLLFDYYTVLKKSNPKDATKIIEEMISTLDEGIEHIAEIFSQSVKDGISYEDAISLDELKSIVSNNREFKQIFENIYFSTKIIIVGKKQFIEFMNMLIDNGLDEIALKYLDDVSDALKYDKQIRELFSKLQKIDS